MKSIIAKAIIMLMPTIAFASYIQRLPQGQIISFNELLFPKGEYVACIKDHLLQGPVVQRNLCIVISESGEHMPRKVSGRVIVQGSSENGTNFDIDGFKVQSHFLHAKTENGNKLLFRCLETSLFSMEKLSLLDCKHKDFVRLLKSLGGTIENEIDYSDYEEY